ncbi:transmembrane signal receptor [Lithospermum erythrorhizon]|uniref:Transmembrane signal receptor n=1 Tax=Lithospermum erythrorhizon TaxID=34254 RepID=A0AAV3QXI1_LITER
MVSDGSDSGGSPKSTTLLLTSAPPTNPIVSPSSSPLDPLSPHPSPPYPKGHHFVSIKLTTKNHAYWLSQITPFLTYQGLYPHVDGSLPVPPYSEAAFSVWYQRDQLVMSILISSLSEEVMAIPIGHTTARGIWLAIETSLASHSLSRSLQLQAALHELRQNDLTISEYMTKAKVLFTDMQAIGKHPSSDDFLVKVLFGLKPEFNEMVSSIVTKVGTLSFEEVHNLLLTQECLVNSRNSVTNGGVSSLNPLANSAQRSGSHPPPSGPSNHVSGYNGRGARYYGQRGGRGRGYNQQNPRFSRYGSGQSSRLISSYSSPGSGHRQQPCQLCNSLAHQALACPKYVTAEAHMSLPAPQSQFQRAPSNAWYPDTGATHHVTPDLASLQIYDDYSGPDPLHVGNGTGLSINHVGSSNIYAPNHVFQLSDILHVPQITKPLLSVQKFCHDNNVIFEFTDSSFLIKDKTSRKTLLTGPTNNGLYRLQPIAISASASPATWHHRLGHPHSRVLQQILSRHSSRRSSGVLDLIFTDVWGLSPKLSSEGMRYYVLFVDDFSLFVWLFLIAVKSDVFPTFLRFQKFVERQFSTKIKSVQSDWGGEYRSLNKYFQEIGIEHRLACPHTHHQMGRVERRHRHIVDTGLTLLAHAGLDFKYWQYAFDTAVFLINRPVPTPNGLTQPDMPYASTPFHFKQPTSLGLSTLPHPTSPSSSATQTISSKYVPPPPALHSYRLRSTTNSLKPNKIYDHSVNMVDAHLFFEPTCFSQANKCPLWRAAMHDEINAMIRTNTWTLVPRSSSMNVIGCRWIFKLKRDSQGNIVRRRARLVAKGHHQQEGVDFFDPFSLVIKHSTIRILLTLAVIFSWSVKQLDIQNAFLNGDLVESVYMQQPPGFISDSDSSFVC